MKCDNEISEFFTTDTGIPQRGGYSANEFTFYLANSLADDHNDHNYAMQSTQDVEIEMEYADDLTDINTSKEIQEQRNALKTERLKSRGLNVNATKTEEYEIKYKGDESWKDSKLLGTKLDTKKDICILL